MDVILLLLAILLYGIWVKWTNGRHFRYLAHEVYEQHVYACRGRGPSVPIHPNSQRSFYHLSPEVMAERKKHLVMWGKPAAGRWSRVPKEKS